MHWEFSHGTHAIRYDLKSVMLYKIDRSIHGSYITHQIQQSGDSLRMDPGRSSKDQLGHAKCDQG